MELALVRWPATNNDSRHLVGLGNSYLPFNGLIKSLNDLLQNYYPLLCEEVHDYLRYELNPVGGISGDTL